MKRERDFSRGMGIGVALGVLACLSLGSYSTFQVSPAKPANLFLGAFTCALAIETPTECVEAEVLATDYKDHDGGEAECVFLGTYRPRKEKSCASSKIDE
jgi:hypothetical protein